MKIVSCEGCGVVLDADRLKFPSDIYADSGGVDDTKAAWSGSAWVAFCNCPVCDFQILEE